MCADQSHDGKIDAILEVQTTGEIGRMLVDRVIANLGEAEMGWTGTIGSLRTDENLGEGLETDRTLPAAMVRHL